MPARSSRSAWCRAWPSSASSFQDDDIFVPEMLIAARAMKEATVVLEPHLVEAGIRPEYTAVIGTVEGDLHDIGKNLVGMMRKGADDRGDRPRGQRPAVEVRRGRARAQGPPDRPDLPCSPPPCRNMRAVVEAVKASGVGAKVMIGGAPTTPGVRGPDRRRRLRCRCGRRGATWPSSSWPAR